MALITCPSCRTHQSDMFTVCDACGAPLKGIQPEKFSVLKAIDQQANKRKIMKWVLIAVAAGFVIHALLSIKPPAPLTPAQQALAEQEQQAKKASDQKRQEEQAEQTLLDSAKADCQVEAENALLSPSSAEFIYASQGVHKDGLNTYSSFGDFDAQNVYGAKIRSGYVCTVKYIGHDSDGHPQWHTEYLHVLNRSLVR